MKFHVDKIAIFFSTFVRNVLGLHADFSINWLQGNKQETDSETYFYPSQTRDASSLCFIHWHIASDKAEYKTPAGILNKKTYEMAAFLYAILYNLSVQLHM